MHALVRVMVTNMVRAVQSELEEQDFAMLWLVAYVFLLRLPSEACVLALCVLTPCTCSSPFHRPCQSAKPGHAAQELRKSSPSFGYKMTPYAFAYCAGRTGREAAARSCASAHARAAWRHAPYTLSGIAFSLDSQMELILGRTSPRIELGSACDRC